MIQTSKKSTRRDYQLAFISITKLFANDELSLDEYKTMLHILCDNYRKDYK